MLPQARDIFCVHNGRAVTVCTPVKINLALHVTGRRADGYHLLESLVVFSPQGDVISIGRADCDSFSIDGPFATALEAGEENLVVRARDVLRAASGGRTGPVAIRLTKRLPVSAGLGGGSGDAAATLAALEALMPTGLGAEGLTHCALALGADVPMCLAGLYHRSALMARGIGDEISLLPAFPALHLVLLNPGTALATPAVFAALESSHNSPPVFDARDVDARDASAFDRLVTALRQTGNDLYGPARRMEPLLDVTLECLRESGALLARMSGSGATCFGLYADAAAAQAAARRIAVRHPDFFVMATTTSGKRIDEHT